MLADQSTCKQHHHNTLHHNYTSDRLKGHLVSGCLTTLLIIFGTEQKYLT